LVILAKKLKNHLQKPKKRAIFYLFLAHFQKILINQHISRDLSLKKRIKKAEEKS